ncbi:hypothetical protein IM40_08515 [Candidatus Paracaedimonas acanthamoebae]|nr:hypothetical protein IM40_08515 [Candidatus Paracaedimonas acanthamoebae]
MTKFINIFFLLLFVCQNQVVGSCNMDIEEDSEQASLHFLPPEIIVHIAGFLEENDFKSFRLVSPTINNIVESHSPFFMPNDSKKIEEAINECSFEQLDNLVNKWRKTPRSTVTPKLNQILNDFKISFSEENKTLKRKFKNYVKIMNILYSFNDKEITLKFKDTYQAMQQRVHACIDYEDMNEDTIINPELYLLYLQCQSFLSKETRGFIAEIYKEGKFSIPQNEQKFIKYNKRLNLPLDISSIYNAPSNAI